MECGRKIGPYDCCSVVCGDCLELMKAIPYGAVDAVITDPPYGLKMGDSKEKRRSHHLEREHYASYEDSLENFLSTVPQAISLSRAIARRVAVFTAGNRVTFFPACDALGGIYQPNAVGRSQWGFTTFLPILFYGKAPEMERGCHPLTLLSTGQAEHNGHPCPKPIKWIMWLVNRASLPSEAILDPFLGSGTTAVAAKNLDRHFLGFEISEEYCRIARERIALVEAQPNLFEKKAEQGKLNI